MGASIGAFFGCGAGNIVADSTLKGDWGNYPVETQLLGACLIFIVGILGAVVGTGIQEGIKK